MQTQKGQQLKKNKQQDLPEVMKKELTVTKEVEAI